MATSTPLPYHSDSDEHEEEDEPHFINGIHQNGDIQSNDADGGADDKPEFQDDDMVAYRNASFSGDDVGDEGSDDDDDESEISSAQDDNSHDSDVDVSILDDLADDKAEPDMSFQEVQQRLSDRKRELEQRTFRIKDLEVRLNESNKRNSQLKQEKMTLQATIERLKNQLKGIREPPEPWQEKLARGLPRDDVWRAFAKQNNMSTRNENRHPGLNWDSPENWVSDDAGYESADSDVSATENEALLRPPQDPVGSEVEPEASNFVFKFDMLPLAIQERVFRYLFVKTELIHCISRFDPGGNDSTVFHRFHIGPSYCTVRRAHRPASILKYFLVSKRWLLVGVTCFFSQNTFAFSSLGEFGSFMAWLPRARRERMQHIEIFWQGSIMPRHETRINQRTLPLTYLCKTPRLKTLVVHIQEMDKSTRRPYERLDCDELEDLVDDKIFEVDELDPVSINPYKLMKRTTGAQPNFRANRSMRTCHGMEYIYQLRGMKWIRFKQSDREGRENIRDWSFVEDLNSVVTMPKAVRDASSSELENLHPISGLRDFEVADADWEIIYRWYGQAPPASVLGDTQGAPSIPPSKSEASTVFGLRSDDYSDENDDNDESDGSDGSDSNDSSNGGGGDVDNDGSDGDSAVTDHDSGWEMEIEGSPGHGNDIGVTTLSNFIDLTLDSEDEEPHSEPAGLRSPQSVLLSSDKASDTRSRPESLLVGSDKNSDKGSKSEFLFVRSENDSEKESKSESLFVRSDSSSNGSVNSDDSGDDAQQKRFVIDLTKIDEGTEPSSQDTVGPSKQGVLPTKGEGEP